MVLARDVQKSQYQYQYFLIESRYVILYSKAESRNDWMFVGSLSLTFSEVVYKENYKEEVAVQLLYSKCWVKV